MDWEILYYDEDVQEIINAWPVGFGPIMRELQSGLSCSGQTWVCPLPVQGAKGYLRFGLEARKGLDVLSFALL
jgi:hypothetical protein